jgi:YgjP-like, metallopeptidase domain
VTAELVLDRMHVPVEVGGRSRRARLTIERDGSLRLRAAEDVETDELQAFLASKREWIYKSSRRRKPCDTRRLPRNSSTAKASYTRSRTMVQRSGNCWAVRCPTVTIGSKSWPNAGQDCGLGVLCDSAPLRRQFTEVHKVAHVEFSG